MAQKRGGTGGGGGGGGRMCVCVRACVMRRKGSGDNGSCIVFAIELMKQFDVIYYLVLIIYYLVLIIFLANTRTQVT